MASLGVWPLGTFAWCVRSARTAPFRTRSLRAAFTNEPITPTPSHVILALVGPFRAPAHPSTRAHERPHDAQHHGSSSG